MNKPTFTKARLTAHARKQITDKGFDPRAVTTAIRTPERVTEVRAHPGQVRLIASGVAVVGRVESGTFVALTVYADGVLTPPRADQMDTPEGRRYAERYARGLGRG